MKRLMLGLAGLLITAGAGCYSGYDPYYYDYGYYDPYYYTYDSAYAYGTVDPLTGGVYYLGTTNNQPTLNDPASTATAIANAANTNYTPAGCANATAAGAVVNYNFVNCVGPLGETINGNATLTVADVNGQRTFSATSSNLTVNGIPYVLDLQVVPSHQTTGSQKSATIVSKSFSPTQVDSRQAQGTVTWTQGSNCVEVDGQSESTRGDFKVTSTVSGLRRCRGQCPSAGTVAVQAPDGTFTATFNGSNKVTVTAPNGHTKDYDLKCP